MNYQKYIPMVKYFLTSYLILTTFLSFGKSSSEALWWRNNCYPSVHLVAPSTYYISTGKDVYVKMIASNNQYCIKYVDLYLGKQFIGRDNTSPYEWAKPSSSDHPELRNLPPGVYGLSAVVKYVSGKKKIIPRKFEIKSPYASSNQFAWMNKIKKALPFHKIDEYRHGNQIYFKILHCRSRSSAVVWHDCRGRVLSSNAQINRKVTEARFIKCWFDPCH